MLDVGQSVAKALRSKINDSNSKSLRQSSKFAAANRRRNADRYRFEFKELWDAEEVTVTQKGTYHCTCRKRGVPLSFWFPLRRGKSVWLLKRRTKRRPYSSLCLGWY